MDIAEYFKAILDRLSFSIGIAVAVTSGFTVFSPWLQSIIDERYQVIAFVAFVFSSVWVLSEATRWVWNARNGRAKSNRLERSKLYMEIHLMQKSFGGLRGKLAYPDHHFEVAAEIADKYARLKCLGIETPDIDPSADQWDFEPHNRYLTALSPLLSNSPIKDLKNHAQTLLKQ